MKRHNGTPWQIHAIFILLSVLCIFPLLLVLVISFSDETMVMTQGYSLFPAKWSLEAYRYLVNDWALMARSYGVTILVTVAGTIGCLVITSMFAWPLSRKELPFRGFFTFLVFFSVLFNSGLVPWYIVYTKLLNFKDSILALIVPNLLMNGFYVLIMRTFFANTIPPAVVESAYIDGAGELRIFISFVLPLSTPVIATIGLFATLAYWNDWYNGMVFFLRSDMFSLQYMLNRILFRMQFLSEYSNYIDNAALLAELPQHTVRMALAVVGIGPIVIAYPFFHKYFVKGMTIGAVKG